MCYDASEALQPGYDLIDQPEILFGFSSQNGNDVDNNGIFAEAHRCVPLVLFCYPLPAGLVLILALFLQKIQRNGRGLRPILRGLMSPVDYLNIPKSMGG